MGFNKTAQLQANHNRKYIPPPQGNIDSFIDTLEENLENLDLNKIELFLMGDFNIDWSDKNNPNF